MRHIDETTHGLSERIIEATTKAEIAETELDEAGRFARTMSNLGNTLAAPFNAAARGKAKQAKATNFLMSKFKEFARGRPYSTDLIHQFLSRTLGQQIADGFMRPSTSNTSTPQPSNIQPPNTRGNAANTGNAGSSGNNGTTPPPTNPSAAPSAAPNPAATPTTPVGSSPSTTNTTTGTTSTNQSPPHQIPGNASKKAQQVMKNPASNASSSATPNTPNPTPAGANANRGQILARIQQQVEALKTKKSNPDQMKALFNQLIKVGSEKGKNSPEYSAMVKEVNDLKDALVSSFPNLKDIDPTNVAESFRSKRQKIK